MNTPALAVGRSYQVPNGEHSHSLDRRLRDGDLAMKEGWIWDNIQALGDFNELAGAHNRQSRGVEDGAHQLDSELATQSDNPEREHESPNLRLSTSRLLRSLEKSTATANCLRYPVLKPVVGHLQNIMPVDLACDLLDVYFASSPLPQMHPTSPYVLAFLFRKQAILHPTQPRKCQPALLASMLWIAAQTSDFPELNRSPRIRSTVCDKLWHLTFALIQPLIHSSDGGAVYGDNGSPAVYSPVGNTGVGEKPHTLNAAEQIDRLVTYINLATIASASEHKGASIRWWSAAWSLARDLKLGKELPTFPFDEIDDHDQWKIRAGSATEEEREERRRIWWLLYAVDRHTALCYNRPLVLLDADCQQLLRPIDEEAWQNGNFNSSTVSHAPHSDSGSAPRLLGPPIECQGHDIFGFFLPLMTILGEVVDLHHLKYHPRFGNSIQATTLLSQLTDEVRERLRTYELSLRMFGERHLPKTAVGAHQPLGSTRIRGEANGVGCSSAWSLSTEAINQIPEKELQSRLTVAYGLFIMQVMHVLLDSPWDPTELLDETYEWISTPIFVTAASHAVAAAEAADRVLELDPALEFMPFLLGIYLLQGSLLLLLIVDKIPFDASSSIIRACETLVRANETCIVTLHTDCQVCEMIVFASF